jgi:hypothetical protein
LHAIFVLNGVNVNDYIDIAKKVEGSKSETPAAIPTTDHSAQVNIALDMARRQAEKPAPVEKPIPPLGTMPIPN